MLPSLQRSGSSRIPATSVDGYFRYIAESVVIANFIEAKRNRQDAKKKCCILFFIGIYFQEKIPGSISGLFRRESVGLSLDAIVFFSQTRSVLQPEFVLGELMLGRLIKAPVQLLHTE